MDIHAATLRCLRRYRPKLTCPIGTGEPIVGELWQVPNTSVVDEDGIAHLDLDLDLDERVTEPPLSMPRSSCTYGSRRSSSLSDSEIAPGIAALRLPAFSSCDQLPKVSSDMPELLGHLDDRPAS